MRLKNEHEYLLAKVKCNLSFACVHVVCSGDLSGGPGDALPFQKKLQQEPLFIKVHAGAFLKEQ